MHNTVFELNAYVYRNNYDSFYRFHSICPSFCWPSYNFSCFHLLINLVFQTRTKMPTASSNDGKPLSVSDFTSMYNKWLKELVNIENTLMKKAEDTQALQSTLNEDADTVIIHRSSFLCQLMEIVGYYFSISAERN